MGSLHQIGSVQSVTSVVLAAMKISIGFHSFDTVLSLLPTLWRNVWAIYSTPKLTARKFLFQMFQRRTLPNRVCFAVGRKLLSCAIIKLMCALHELVDRMCPFVLFSSTRNILVMQQFQHSDRISRWSFVKGVWVMTSSSGFSQMIARMNLIRHLVFPTQGFSKKSSPLPNLR